MDIKNNFISDFKTKFNIKSIKEDNVLSEIAVENSTNLDPILRAPAPQPINIRLVKTVPLPTEFVANKTEEQINLIQRALSFHIDLFTLKTNNIKLPAKVIVCGKEISVEVDATTVDVVGSIHYLASLTNVPDAGNGTPGEDHPIPDSPTVSNPEPDAAVSTTGSISFDNEWGEIDPANVPSPSDFKVSFVFDAWNPDQDIFLDGTDYYVTLRGTFSIEKIV